MIPKQPEQQDRFEAALAAIWSAAENLKFEVENLESHPARSMRLALHTAYKALKRCQEAEGLSPSARQEVRSAIRMCSAELELETA